MKLTQKINRKILPYVFSLGIGASTIFGNYGCVDSARAQTVAKTEQVRENSKNDSYNPPYVRSYGNKKVDGGVYSDKDIVDDTYFDGEGKKHYTEESTIRDINYDNHSVEFGISPLAFEYGKSEKCTIQPALIESTNNKPTYILTGSLEGNRVSFDIENPESLYTGVLCAHDNYTERLAAYSVSLGNREKIENKYNKPSKGNVIPTKDKIRENNQDNQNKPKTDKIRENNQGTKPKVTEKIDVNQDTNVDNSYHLRTDCEQIYTISGRSSDKYGQIEVEEGSSCKIYLDEKGNTIDRYNIEPAQDSDKVLSAMPMNEMSLELNFKEDGIYSVIIGTNFYPDEKDILQFNVVDKEIVQDNLFVTEVLDDVTSPIENSEISNTTQPKTEGVVTLEDLIPGTDEFNAEVLVKPFLMPRVDITTTKAHDGQESLNEILMGIGDETIPYLSLHQENSLEIKVKDTDLEYKARLFEIDNINKNGFVLDEVEIKKTVGKNRYVIDVDGSVAQITGKKIVFPYNERVVGAYKDSTGNSYLLMLMGYDENGEVKDLDTLIIEINANLLKEKAKGFAVGMGLGYFLGAYDASNSGGLFTVDKGHHSSNSLNIFDKIKGTKSGGNIPQ